MSADERAASLDSALDRFKLVEGDTAGNTVKVATIAISLYSIGEKRIALRQFEDIARSIRQELFVEEVRPRLVRDDDDDTIWRCCDECGRLAMVSLVTGKSRNKRAFRRDLRYCSDACRQRAYRKRKR